MTLDIVDFIENCFRCFVLQGQLGELSLFVFCFPFAHIKNLQLVLNILGAEHIFVPFTTLYINFGTDANKFYPRYLLAVALKMCKTVRDEYLTIRLSFTRLDSPNDGDIPSDDQEMY